MTNHFEEWGLRVSLCPAVFLCVWQYTVYSMSTSGQSENSTVLSSVIAYFSSSLWMLHCVQSCLYSELIHIQWNLCKRFHTLRFAEVSEKHLDRPEYIQGRWSERYSFLWNLRANKGGHPLSKRETRKQKTANSKAAGRRKCHSRKSPGQKEEIWPINRFYKDRLFRALFGAEERKELTREISEWHEESSISSARKLWIILRG